MADNGWVLCEVAVFIQNFSSYSNPQFCKTHVIGSLFYIFVTIRPLYVESELKNKSGVLISILLNLNTK